jgi:hypothetical protein
MAQFVPVEFVGKARAFRRPLVADHPAAIAMVDRLALPFHARFRSRQPPTIGALAGLTHAWRERMPSSGRLHLVINTARARLTIVETRAAPATFRFDDWDEGDVETAIVITSLTLIVSPELFRFGNTPVASVPLHALARRFQRGWDVSDAAVRADLAALACPCPDVLASGGEFTVPLADGCWVGTVTEIEARGEPARILVVRSFIGAHMSARPDMSERASA